MIRFTATILKFKKQGEKTGWTYIEIPANIAQQLKFNNRKEFKTKGKLDNYLFQQKAVLPMGNGDFILPLNAEMRKIIYKKQGDSVAVQIEEDKSEFVFNPDFMDCLEEELQGKTFFKSLTGSHQRYFSKWIDSAKTDSTKIKRIGAAVNALSKNQDFPTMMRTLKSNRIK